MKIEVTAFPRTLQGTGASRRLRTSGRVPGVIYGANKPALAIELDHSALQRHLKLEAFHSSILEMTVDGNKEPVLLRDFQMHPWRPMVQHVDFQRIDKNKKIHMYVPLHFINEDVAPGVKLGGGVVQHAMNEVEVQCLPDDLPGFIEIDLKDMQLDDSIHVADIVLPKGVELFAKLRQDNPPVVMLHLPKVVEIEETVEAPVTEITGQVPEAEAAEGERKEGAKKEPEKKEAAKKE